MSKTKTPLLSFQAQGTLGKDMALRKSGRGTVAEKRPAPSDARSAVQLSWRTMFEKCTLLWHTLSASEKAVWERLGRARHMTGYALWQSQCLRPNPGIYLPLAGGTMTGGIDMGANAITNLDDPVLAQDADTLAARSAAIASAAYTQGAHVRHSLAQLIVRNTYQTLAFDSELFDTDAMHSTTVNNSRLTCQTAGKYLLVAQVSWESSAPARRIVVLHKNADVFLSLVDAVNGATKPQAQNTVTIDALVVEDYVEVWVYHEGLVDVNVVTGGTYTPGLSAQRIG